MGLENKKKVKGIPAKSEAAKKPSSTSAKVEKRSRPEPPAPSAGGSSEGLKAVLAQHPQNKLNEDLAGRAIDALLLVSKKKAQGRRDLLGDEEKVTKWLRRPRHVPPFDLKQDSNDPMITTAASLFHSDTKGLLELTLPISFSTPAPLVSNCQVHMQITLKRVPTDQASPKPIPLAVPHPVHGPNEDTSVCLFVKAEDATWAKDLLVDSPGGPVSGVAEVISLDKLRTDYARFEQRRELLATYDVFMADDRILPMLCKVRRVPGGR